MNMKLQRIQIPTPEMILIKSDFKVTLEKELNQTMAVMSRNKKRSVTTPFLSSMY